MVKTLVTTTMSFDVRWPGHVRLWEVATGQQIRELKEQKPPSFFFELRLRALSDRQGGFVYSAAFSPDGKTLAAEGYNTTVLIWQLPEVYSGGPLTAKLDAKELQSLWDGLAKDDAAKAYKAVGTLILGGKEAVPFLHEQLQPAPNAQRVARLLADLDSDEFAVREKASNDLEQLGDQAESALRKALASQPSAEVQRRVEDLLNKLSAPAKRLRIQRAVMVLEQIGSPEAKELLETLSKGADGALLTEEAKAARKRMHP